MLRLGSGTVRLAPIGWACLLFKPPFALPSLQPTVIILLFVSALLLLMDLQQALAKSCTKTFRMSGYGLTETVKLTQEFGELSVQGQGSNLAVESVRLNVSVP